MGAALKSCLSRSLPDTLWDMPPKSPEELRVISTDTLILLTLLRRQPATQSEVIADVALRTDSRLELTSSNVSPRFKVLDKLDLVESTTAQGQRLWQLTIDGLAIAEEHEELICAVTNGRDARELLGALDALLRVADGFGPKYQADFYLGLLERIQYRVQRLETEPGDLLSRLYSHTIGLVKKSGFHGNVPDGGDE